MTVFIGITQTPQETETNISQEFKISGTKTVVGPFRTSEDASKWMRYIMARRSGFKDVTPAPSKSLVNNEWFGFTFEHIDP